MTANCPTTSSVNIVMNVCQGVVNLKLRNATTLAVENVSKTLQSAQQTLNASSRVNAAIPNLKYVQVVSITVFRNKDTIVMEAFAQMTANALRVAAKNPIKNVSLLLQLINA